MTQNEFLSHLHGVKRASRGFIALCPAHEDKNPSLSITEGEDGRILLKCHAGCSAEAVAGALGLTVKDLFPDAPDRPLRPLPLQGRPARERSDQPRKVVAVYNYGFAKKVRYEPKSFAWYRPRSGWTVEAESELPPHEQDWIPGRGNHEKTLYAPCGIHNYPLIVEGEKDADSLSRLGMYAVSPEDGAGEGKWVESYTSALLRAGVTHAFICPDNDPVGYAFGEEIAAALRRAGVTAVILPLTAVWADAPLHADWSDHMAAFGEDGTVEATVAGLPKASILKIEGDPFEAFDLDGMVLEAEAEIKNTISYNDEPTDAIVDGEPMHEESSAGIYSIGFTLNLDKAYHALIVDGIERRLAKYGD